MITATHDRTLDLYLSTEQVVGQEKARRQLAVLLNRQWQVYRGEIDRSSGALLAGRSGVGKTFSAHLMCQHLGLPFAEVDATRYTEAGYKGLDLNQIFVPLLESAAQMKDAEHPLEASRFAPRETSEPVIAFDSEGGLRLKQRPGERNRESSVLKREDIDEVVERAQTGVILLDEFDKWMLRINHVTGEKDKAIQAELLKMIEGSREYVTDSDAEIGVAFETGRVLIICAGAFVGLYAQVRKRMHADADDKSVESNESFWNQIVPEDFERFGLLPELAGRLSTHIFTRPLRTDHLTTIMQRPGGAIDRYRAQFEAQGCRWAVSEAGVIGLASRAMDRLIGARGVDFVMWKYMSTALYDAAVADFPCEVIFEPSMEQAVVRAR